MFGITRNSAGQENKFRQGSLSPVLLPLCPLVPALPVSPGMWQVKDLSETVQKELAEKFDAHLEVRKQTMTPVLTIMLMADGQMDSGQSKAEKLLQKKVAKAESVFNKAHQDMNKAFRKEASKDQGGATGRQMLLSTAHCHLAQG